MYAVIVRALIPIGFMPDDGALRAGRLALMLCPQAGVPVSQQGAVGMDGHPHGDFHAMHATHGDHAAHAATGDIHVTGPACPLWLTAQAAWPAPAPVLMPISLTALLWRIAAAVPVVPQTRSLAAGPPLGSRAPPHTWH